MAATRDCAEQKRLEELRRLKNQGASRENSKNYSDTNGSVVSLEELNDQVLTKNNQKPVTNAVKKAGSTENGFSKSNNSKNSGSADSSSESGDFCPQSALDDDTRRRRRKVYLATEEFRKILSETDIWLNYMRTAFIISAVMVAFGVAGNVVASGGTIALYSRMALILGIIGAVAAFWQLANGEKKLCDLNEVVIEGYNYTLSEEWTRDRLRLLARRLAVTSKAGVQHSGGTSSASRE